MQEPIKTSSIFVFATSVISFTLSGSLGQATIGCVTFAKSISISLKIV